MKKWIFLLTVCLLATGYGAYTAYLSGGAEPVKQQQYTGPLKPGVYKVEYDQADFRGWKAFFSMEVNPEGVMQNVAFDYIDLAGGLKTKNLTYSHTMKKKSGVGPIEYCPRFAKNLEIYQNPDQVDGITGATASSRDFKVFAKAAYEAAKSGNTATVYIPQPETKNHSEEKK